jgi:hypothetical protein
MNQIKPKFRSHSIIIPFDKKDNMKIQALFLTAMYACSEAFLAKPMSLRNGFSEGTSGILASARVGSSSQLAMALKSCPPNSKNCIHTTWKAPQGTKYVKGDMLKIINSYPQEGQAGVDKGGWKIVEGSLKLTGKTRIEYTSGLGMFAKLFNKGNPFIDDLEIEVSGNEIEMRSSSRIGQSDLGVNQKRLKFLVSKAQALGWDAPEPKY